MQRDGTAKDWGTFREANDDLFARKPSILERYYAPETLKSEAARRTFVLPDAGLSKPVMNRAAKKLRRRNHGAVTE